MDSKADVQIPCPDVGGQAAQLACAVVLYIPPFRVVGVIDVGIFDGVEDRQGEVRGIGGIEQGLCSVFSAGQGQGVDSLELGSRGQSTSHGLYTLAMMLTPKVAFEMGWRESW